MHSYGLILIFDFDPTVMCHFPLSILSAVNIIYSERLLQLEASNLQTLLDLFIQEVLSCSTVQQGFIISYLVHGAKLKRQVHCLNSSNIHCV